MQQFAYHEPTQPRAARTFKRILNTALDIIERENIDALNTNKIAKECGINISTLYHYFPNKDVILYALYEQWFQRVSEITLAHRTALKSKSDLKKCFTNILNDVLTIEDYSPKSAISLEQAMKSRSELAEYDNYITELSVEFYIEALSSLGSKKGYDEFVVIGSLLLVSVWGAIAAAASSPKSAYSMICEYAADMMVTTAKRALKD
ncbi:TetR/AcrR family transcriptional regulator [Maricurvus nonylphenolicus]|uniref:TetR/AcrR family transcriptional regulator n=1 Tax=Maricurvus nonylphenolicus TaxID=1008307 RepID=UPI0036F29047